MLKKRQEFIRLNLDEKQLEQALIDMVEDIRNKDEFEFVEVQCVVQLSANSYTVVINTYENE